MHQPKAKERWEESNSPILESDVALRQRQSRISPSPPKRKRSTTYPPPNDAHVGDKKDKKKRRKRTPTPPCSPLESSSSTPLSSSHESTDSHESKPKKRSKQKSYAAWKRARKLRKFKEGGKELKGPPTKYCLSFNNTMRLLETKNFQSPQSSGMCPCTFKNRLANGGQVCVPKEKPQRLGKQWGLPLWINSCQVMQRTKYSPNGGVCACNLKNPSSGIDKFWELHLKATVSIRR